MFCTWHLSSDTGVAELTFQDNVSKFTVIMKLQDFVSFGENIRDAADGLRAALDRGLSASDAISEWQRMLREKREKQKGDSPPV